MKGKAHLILSEKKTNVTPVVDTSQSDTSTGFYSIASEQKNELTSSEELHDYQFVDEAEITPLPDSEDEYVCVFESDGGELTEKVVTYC